MNTTTTTTATPEREQEIRATLLAAGTPGEIMAAAHQAAEYGQQVAVRGFEASLFVALTVGEGIVLAYRATVKAKGEAPVAGLPTWSDVTKVLPESDLLSGIGRSRSAAREDLAVFTYCRETGVRAAWDVWRKQADGRPMSVRGFLTFSRQTRNRLLGEDGNLTPQAAAAATVAKRRDLAVTLAAEAEAAAKVKADADAKAKADRVDASVSHATHHPHASLVTGWDVTGEQVMSADVASVKALITALSDVVAWREAAAKDEAKAKREAKAKGETEQVPAEQQPEQPEQQPEQAESQQDMAAIVAAVTAAVLAQMGGKA